MVGDFACWDGPRGAVQVSSAASRVGGKEVGMRANYCDARLILLLKSKSLSLRKLFLSL